MEIDYEKLRKQFNRFLMDEVEKLEEDTKKHEQHCPKCFLYHAGECD